MNEKVMVRLFFFPSCSCSGGCGPNMDVAAFELVAEKLVEKFGMEKLEFEAYPAIEIKRFPYFLKAVNSDGKIVLPVVSVDETVLAPGVIPSFSELETEVANRFKVI